MYLLPFPNAVLVVSFVSPAQSFAPFLSCFPFILQGGSLPDLFLI